MTWAYLQWETKFRIFRTSGMLINSHPRVYVFQLGECNVMALRPVIKELLGYA